MKKELEEKRIEKLKSTKKISHGINMSYINNELGYSPNYLKRTNKDFPEWMLPKVLELSELVEDFIDEISEIRYERKQRAKNNKKKQKTQ